MPCDLINAGQIECRARREEKQLRYRLNFDDYSRKSNKHDEVHEWKVKTGLTEAMLQEFADSLQEGGIYKLHVEKIIVTQDGYSRNNPETRKEWTHGELVKKYPHLALFQIGKRRRESFMYKDLYMMARDLNTL